jgi:hypothetical protein
LGWSLGCRGRRGLGRSFCWTKRGWANGYTQPKAAQALVLGSATLFFFALRLGSFLPGAPVFFGTLLRVDAGLFLGAASCFLIRLALGFGFLFALFLFAAALFFLGAALLVLALTLIFLTGLGLGLILVDQGHHLTDVLVLDVRAGTRLDGDAMLLSDRKDVLAFHPDGLG